MGDQKADVIVVVEYKNGEKYVMIRHWDDRDSRQFFDEESKRDNPIKSLRLAPLAEFMPGGNRFWLPVCTADEKSGNDNLIVLEYENGEIKVSVRDWDYLEAREFIESEKAKKDNCLKGFSQYKVSTMKPGVVTKKGSWVTVYRPGKDIYG